jgi:hypothetical protein
MELGGFMKNIILTALILVSCSLTGFAQGNEKRGWGYLVAGGGAANDGAGLTQVAGGGEVLLFNGFAIGGEIGGISVGKGGNSFGVASFNLSGHFNRSQKLQPFITGGATLGFRSGTAGGGNVGGGVQYWFKEHVGLRIEARDYLFSSDRYNYFIVRAGISFR